MARRTFAFAVIVPVLIAALAACTSSSGGGDPSKSPSTPTGSSVSSTASVDPASSAPTSSTPSSTAPGDDPRGKAAVTAYTAFVSASYTAERKPTDLTLVNALKAHSVDPALATEGQHLFGYRNSGIAWEGQPPTPRVTVQTITTTGAYPTVTLNDCQTVSSTWKPYIVKTHKAVPITYPTGSAKPPHAIAVKVIYFKNRWMVQSTTTNVKKTCVPS